METFKRSGWLDDGHPLCIGPFVIRRFVDDSQIGTIPPKANRLLPHPWLQRLTATRRYPRSSSSFSTGPRRQWPGRCAG